MYCDGHLSLVPLPCGAGAPAAGSVVGVSGVSSAVTSGCVGSTVLDGVVLGGGQPQIGVGHQYIVCIELDAPFCANSDLIWPIV